MRSLRSSSRLNSRTFSDPDFGGGFPVHVAGRIFRHVLANQIQVVAAAAGKSFKFASDQREHFKEFVGRSTGGIHQDLPRQRHAPGLGKKSKGKTCSQAKAILLITPAAREA